MEHVVNLVLKRVTLGTPTDLRHIAILQLIHTVYYAALLLLVEPVLDVFMLRNLTERPL